LWIEVWTDLLANRSIEKNFMQADYFGAYRNFEPAEDHGQEGQFVPAMAKSW